MDSFLGQQPQQGLLNPGQPPEQQQMDPGELLRRSAGLGKEGFRNVLRKLDPTVAQEFEDGSASKQDKVIEGLANGLDVNSVIQEFRNPSPVETIPAGKEVGDVAQISGQLEEEFRKAPTLAALTDTFEKSGIQVASAGKFKIPSGFRLKNQDKPEIGIEPIPGAKDKNQLTPEQSGRLTQILTARKAFDEVKGLMFDEDGTISHTNVINANFNTPHTDGRRLRVGLEQVIQAITRIETGAAMPPEEVNNTRKRFMPTPLDDRETTDLKLELIQSFMDGAVNLIDPNGKLNTEAFDAEIASRRVQKRIAPDADEKTLRSQADAAIAAGAPRELVEKALNDALAGGR